MASKKHRIILEVSDLCVLTNRSMSQCYRTYQLYRDMLGKQKEQSITIREYCKLEGIEDVNEVYEALGIKIE
jgi:hypothetical protein